jgi:hypothetical protein
MAALSRFECSLLCGPLRTLRPLGGYLDRLQSSQSKTQSFRKGIEVPRSNRTSLRPERLASTGFASGSSDHFSFLQKPNQLALSVHYGEGANSVRVH